MKIKNLKDKLFTCGLFVIILAVFKIFDWHCIFYNWFSIPCPGCGMTRAYVSLLHLDFEKAFYYHPMFFTMPILLLYYFFDGRLFKNKYINNGLLILIAIGFFINWILKL